MAIRRLFRTPLLAQLKRRYPPLLIEFAIGSAFGLGLGTVRVALFPAMGSMTPFSLVFVAVTLATVLAGWRAGLVALVSGQALIWYAVFEPRYTFQLRTVADTVAVGVTILSELMVLGAIALYQNEVRAGAAERDELDAARQLVVQEMNHRVKNTLTIVAGIANQTFKSIGDERVSAFQSRILALANAHDLIAKPDASGASIRELLQTCIAPYQPDDIHRISIEGPEVALSSATTVNLALAVNELATNATKYGALSTTEGTVAIAWTLGDGHLLRLRWVERDGPPVAAPTRTGFGTRMIQSGIAAQNGDSVDFDFLPSGLICTITVALA